MDSILASYRTCCEMSISLIVSIRHIRGQRIPYIASISEFRLFECHFGILFTSRNWFVMQGPVAIILISWNVIFILESKTLLRHTLIKKIFLTFLLKPYLYTFSLYLFDHLSIDKMWGMGPFYGHLISNYNQYLQS
jgi:hypothetical protein